MSRRSPEQAVIESARAVRVLKESVAQAVDAAMNSPEWGFIPTQIAQDEAAAADSVQKMLDDLGIPDVEVSAVIDAIKAAPFFKTLSKREADIKQEAKPMAQEFTVGDKVKMATHWLRSTGNYAGEIAHRTGEIVAVTPVDTAGKRQLVTVQWDDGTEAKALNTNLQLAGKPDYDV